MAEMDQGKNKNKNKQKTKQKNAYWPSIAFLPIPWGPLVFEVGYHPRKKIHIIRVVFQDQARYARTSFRGAKTFKNWKQGCVFVILTNFQRT